MPRYVVGGEPATGRFLVSDFRSGELTFTLTSSHPAVLHVPARVVLRPDAHQVEFPIETEPVSSPVTVTIRARIAGLGSGPSPSRLYP